jgi:O-antigen ligase
MTNFQVKTIRTGGIVAALIMLTLPFSTSIPIILSGILFFLWLLSYQFIRLPELLRQNEIAAFSLAIFAGLLVATSYSSAPFEEAISTWSKYREFFLFIVLLPFLRDAQHGKWSIYAFIAGSIVTLAISYAMYFNLVPRPMYAATLKSIITHSIMVALFGFFCALKINTATETKARIIWWLLLFVSLHNLYFVAMGRTGQLLGVLMVLLYCFQHLNTRNSLFLIASLIILVTLFINYSEIGFRISEGFTNVLNYNFDNPETETSMGKRLTFWKHSFTLIGESPWIGHGTGSFETEFKRIATADQYVTKNPHSEFLSLAVQMGISGLLLFLGFLVSQYRLSLKLDDDSKWLAQALLLTIAITSFFNSPILDHTEGHWFACLLALCFAPVSPSNAQRHHHHQE